MSLIKKEPTTKVSLLDILDIGGANDQRAA